MRQRYPHDQFVIVDKPPQSADGLPEWRIKCLDCPGKMYTPGPGLTVENFEKHLKNRQHKQKVALRLGYPLPASGLTPEDHPASLSPSHVSPLGQPSQLQSYPTSRPSSSHQPHQHLNQMQQQQQQQQQQHMGLSPMHPAMGVPMSQSPAQQTDILAAAMYESQSQNSAHGSHSIPHSHSVTPQPPPAQHPMQPMQQAAQQQQQQQQHHLYNPQQFINIPHDLPGTAESIPNSLNMSNMDMNMSHVPSFNFDGVYGADDQPDSGDF